MGDAAPAPRRSRLKLVCAGTGRDGTVSLAHMLQRLFEDAGVSGSVMHEYASRDFLHAYASFRETRDQRWLEEIRALIDACEHDCIVGAGYSAILPMFRERCGPELKVVHLRRADRTACIANQYIAWTGYQIRKSPQIAPADYRSTEHIAGSLETAERTLLKYVDDVRALKALLGATAETAG